MGTKEVAAVTGAAQGIGLAMAKCFARDGFTVVAMDRNASALATALASLVADGLDVIATVADVCERASVSAAFAKLPRLGEDRADRQSRFTRRDR